MHKQITERNSANDQDLLLVNYTTTGSSRHSQNTDTQHSKHTKTLQRTRGLPGEQYCKSKLRYNPHALEEIRQQTAFLTDLAKRIRH